ncbi:fusaric acid resistance family protein [Parasponia andersonii]|uniref:Fusaric acid resistance family protein n=1 Tax=Parasponia andersonii TaxID=3476 RepID=A0A2P5D5Q9_PARAD|nr:fusaric acid resistance family protein [Parasponia andersonii]
MPVMISTASGDQTYSGLWRARLGCALRTALACTIVGCITLYGPEPLRLLLSYPAFSYVTTILIVSEATLGDALRGFWHVIYATVQVLIPYALSLWLIGPARFTKELAAVAVALTAFMVALPESTPLLCKRLAFGQTVIVYVGTVAKGAQTGRAFMHPIHVASSAALGALASILAMLFPFPRLAYCEVRRACRLYAENASKRLSLILEALSAQDTTAAQELISQEKCLSKIGLKLLRSVKDNLGGMAWERPQIKFLTPNLKDLGEKLQAMEIPMRGMEIALSVCPDFPIGVIDEGFKQVLQSSKAQIGPKLEHVKCLLPFDATMAPDGKVETSEKPIWITKTTIFENLPALFLLYCMEFLKDDSPNVPNLESTPKLNSEESKESRGSFRRALSSLIIRPTSSRNFVFAFKCSISLGLAVLFGLIYNKENGYWSGLTIAISFVTGRQATFTVANARVQGTAMGSIYGILCLFLFRRFLDMRFLPLLPWIIFTSFLIHSRTYGQAGAFSAATGALLILGRKDYGPPTEFAIARVTEATIGLICFIAVELLSNPSRAATLAETELLKSMKLFGDCVENIFLRPQQKSASASSRVLREKQYQLKCHVKEFEKFIAEAEMEPNFWFVPFNGGCYRKLLGSFLTVVNLLHFVAYKIEFVSEASERLGGDLEELLKQVNNDLELFKKAVIYSMSRLEEASTTTILQESKKELQTENLSNDIEIGKSTSETEFRHLDEDTENMLQHLEEVVDKIYSCEGTEKLKRQMCLCLTGLGFCIHSLAREAKDIEKDFKEVIKRENPSFFDQA